MGRHKKDMVIASAAERRKSGYDIPDKDPASGRAALISRISSMMGFVPRDSHNAFVVEYAKDYALPGGFRAARATAQFDKGVAGMDHARLKGFVVTVQAYIPAEPQVVKQQAPEVMRDDLLTYIEKLGAVDGETPAALVMIRCESCDTETAEFFSLRNQRLCGRCFAQKVGTASSG